MIPYGKQNIEQDDIDAVVETLRSPFLTQGPKIKEFEDAFAAYVGSSYACALSNGTTALHLAYEALGVKKGDKVITTPISFVATSNGALYCDADVIFADIDPDNFNIDLNAVERILETHPNRKSIKGIAATDFGGLPLEWPRLKAIAKKYNLWLLEDACHAVGAEFKNEKGQWIKTGSGFADISVFSFHPVKHIACGEGGMITTNRKDLFDRISLMRTHGITRNQEVFTDQSHAEWYYEMQELGYNYRLTDMQCALGLTQLKKLPQNVLHRRKTAAIYQRELEGILPFQKESPDKRNSYHLFVVQTPKRDDLYRYLKTEDIHTQVHYIPIHQQPYYVQRYGKQSLPKAEAYFEKCLSLPMYHSLTEDEQEFVISKVKSFLKR